MSREMLVKVSLEFEKENKEEVYKILKKKDWEQYLQVENDGWVALEFSYEVFEEDVKEFKDCCNGIGISEYEYSEDGGFFWENEDDEFDNKSDYEYDFERTEIKE